MKRETLEDLCIVSDQTQMRVALLFFSALLVCVLSTSTMSQVQLPAGPRRNREVLRDPSLSSTFPSPGLAINAGSTVPNDGQQPAVPANTANVLHYYVSPSGSDSNGGSQAHPWATISHASKSLKLGAQGTIVHVLPGWYYFSTNGITTMRSGTASQRIIYQSEVTWGAQIRCGDYGNECWLQLGDYVSIRGFYLTGSKSYGGISLGTNPPVPNCSTTAPQLGCQEALYNEVYKNKLVHLGDDPSICPSGSMGIGASISLLNWTRDAVIDSNVINYSGHWGGCSNGGTSNHGIYVAGFHDTITNNIISNVAGAGVHLYHDPCREVIANNTIFHNYIGGIEVAGEGVQHGLPSQCPTGDDYNSINNNLVIANGFGCGGGTHHGAFGIKFYSTGTNATHNTANNNYMANNFNPSCTPDNNTIVIDSSAGPTPPPSESGNMAGYSVNGIFLNYKNDGSGDYHLTSTSPAIDMGANGNCAQLPGISPCEPTVDFDGVQRPQGSSLDVGSYEF